MSVALTTGRIMPQGSFLPSIPAIALPILNRVVFPGTTQAGRGVLSDAERTAPQPARRLFGPSSYTRGATTQRVGGKYPVHFGNLL